MSLSYIRLFLSTAVSDGIPKRSLIVALLIGTLLNAINQGDHLLTGQHVSVIKLVLTYVVPYCVATYGGATALIRSKRRG